LTVAVRVDPVASQGRKVCDMIKWNTRILRVALALAAVASFAVSAGAGTRWGS
jgi:hypothetical protein